MVCSFFMPRILHILLITLLMNLTPLSLRSLTGAPKMGDVTLIQEFSDGFCGLIRGHICQYMLHELVLEHQDVSNSR